MSTQHNSNLLCEAAKAGNAEEVFRLIPLSDPKDRDSEALQLAAQNGHTECVKLLIPVSGIFSEALLWAAHNGHAGCVELLISVIPLKKDNKPLLWAAERGHTECVELLIPISDPKEHDSLALQRAAANGHTQCVEVLYSVSDPVVALNTLKKYSNHPEKWIVLEQYIETEEAKRLREALVNEVGEGVLNRRHKI